MHTVFLPMERTSLDLGSTRTVTQKAGSQSLLYPNHRLGHLRALHSLLLQLCVNEPDGRSQSMRPCIRAYFPLLAFNCFTPFASSALLYNRSSEIAPVK